MNSGGAKIEALPKAKESIPLQRWLLNPKAFGGAVCLLALAYFFGKPFVVKTVVWGELSSPDGNHVVHVIHEFPLGSLGGETYFHLGKAGSIVSQFPKLHSFTGRDVFVLRHSQLPYRVGWVDDGHLHVQYRRIDGVYDNSPPYATREEAWNGIQISYGEPGPKVVAAREIEIHPRGRAELLGEKK